MSANRFGALVVDKTSSGKWVPLFSGDAGVNKVAVVNYCLQSEYAAPAFVYLAYVVNGTSTEPSPADIVLFHKKLSGCTALQYGPLAVGTGGTIFIKVITPTTDDTAKVSVMAYGLQE